MNTTERMYEIIRNQKAELSVLEVAVKELEGEDFVLTNEKLKEELQQLKKQFNENQKELNRLQEENEKMQQETSGILSAYKNSMIKASRQRFENALVGLKQGTNINRLRHFEQYALNRLNQLRISIEQAQIAEERELSDQINQLEAKVREVSARSSERINRAYEEKQKQAEKVYGRFQEEPVDVKRTAAMLGAAGRIKKQKNRVEQKIGLEQKIGEKVTIIVGLLFIVIAVILGLRYTYTHLLRSDILKVIAAYALGIVFLFAGEWMSRRNQNVFSTGLDAGGIGVLFASTAVAHFNLGVFSKTTALLVCVLITGITLLLAFVRNSQIIAIFALIGGYLPMAAIDPGASAVNSAKIYFLLLNILVLIIAARKKWKVLKFFSFAAHTLGFSFLLLIQKQSNFGIDMIYLSVAFVVYMLISLIYPMMKKDATETSDTVLMGLNLWVQFVTSLIVMHGSEYKDGRGAAAILFCILLFAMGKGVAKYLSQDEETRNMFYASSFAFLALAVPLQFDARLYVLGWLFEGTALCIYGLVRKGKWYAYGGWALCGASLIVFIMETLIRFPGRYMQSVYAWKYSAITFAFLCIWLVWKYRGTEDRKSDASGREGRIFETLQLLVLLNIWLYTSWMASYLLYINQSIWDSGQWKLFAWTALAVFVPFLIRKIKGLTQIDFTVMGIIHVIGFLLLIALNGQSFNHYEPSMQILNHILLIALDFFSIMIFRGILDAYQLEERGMTKDWKTLITTIFTLILISQVMIVQFSVGLESMLLSFIYLGAAIASVLAGFRFSYPAFRRFGLILSFGAVSKLFLIDLSFLVSIQKIISYFVFGFTLIGISYIYQAMNKASSDQENENSE